MEAELSSDVEAILQDAPDQSNRGDAHGSQPRARWSTRLEYECLQPEVHQADDVGHHLHLIP